MKHFLHHLFLPRTSNNQRAQLLHQETMLLIVGFLVVSALFIGSFKSAHPQILGVSVDMSVQDLLLLTNEQRQQNNLPVLQLNDQLGQAAQAKAANMFAENYWAHNSPSGKTPWDFIHAAGYNYIYAGENLARGFSTAQDTVNAWMASPDHRANILSSNYQDVGFAIAQGNLTGDTNTVLVVEEFGSRSFAQPKIVPVAQAQQTSEPTPTPTLIPSPSPVVVTGPVLGQIGFAPQTVIKNSPLINTAFWAKIGMIVLIGIFLLTFILDFIIIGERQMVRIVGHNADHILFLLGILVIAYLLGRGIIF